MTTKHTHTPWRVVTDGINYWVEVNNRIIIVSKGRSKVEAEQHAHLIAAAPEMLEALVDAETVLGENLQFITDLADLAIRQRDSETLKRLKQLNDGWVRLVKAIAKARGEV